VKRHLLNALFALAVVIFLLTMVNASWLAPTPNGGPKLLSHRGIYQQFSREGVDNETCTATRIEPPVHDYLENSIRSMQGAQRLGADMIEMDVVPTADGKIAIFHDWTLDCRTDGKGPTRARTMAELKALDIGHGYSPDGGKTFPFRGTGRGAMPSLEEALAALPNTRILFHFKSKDPREADLLAAALKAARRDVEEIPDAFYGASAPVARIAEHYPDNWAWSLHRAKTCTREYFLYGWTSIVPESCKGGTMIVPLDYQWLAWGWPNRLIDRMAKVGARVVVTKEAGRGLDLPEQLGKIPSTFNGYIWVEDIWTIAPARRPRHDFRTEAQVKAAEAALQRRRDRE
jgi:glycerophosphoryl diester phosphodiesterase